MNFEQYMKGYRPEIKLGTKEYYDLEMTWKAAKRDDYIEEMETYVKITEASYQSKRAKLKKWVTHWMGKFMIVKAENNELRKLVSINKILTKRNNELQEYIATTTSFNGNGKVVKVAENATVLEVKETVHEKVPAQC